MTSHETQEYIMSCKLNENNDSSNIYDTLDYIVAELKWALWPRNIKQRVLSLRKGIRSSPTLTRV